MSKTRFVICVDVEGEPAEAYLKLLKAMGASGLEWESTDEVYGTDGEQIDPDDLRKIIESVLLDRYRPANE